jgi:dCMP deaminase
MKECRQEAQAIIDWDEFFMGVAVLASMRSKDPSTKHGSCIINPETKRIISVGYSGMPLGDDKNYPWDRDAKDRKDTKYPYVIHAEMNAIFNASLPLSGTTMYIYSPKKYLPCNECMKSIVQVGIKEVVVGDYEVVNTKEYDWSPTLKMFEVSGIKLRAIGKNAWRNGLSKMSHELEVAAETF